MEYINLLKKIAWSYHSTTGIDWEELFSIASLAYSESLKTWDMKKGSASTHIWYSVHSKLLDYLKSKKADKNAKLEVELVEEYEEYEYTSSNFFESLTSEAEEIAKLVVRCSGRFAVMNMDEAESRIYSVMRTHGWAIQKTRRAINDLKQACNT